jgi:hypothetical protein
VRLAVVVFALAMHRFPLTRYTFTQGAENKEEESKEIIFKTFESTRGIKN